jgi:hypothetical protein
MKKLVLTFASIFIGVLVNAQDLIVTLKNEETKAKITEVGTSEIKYKKWDNQDGPLFTAAKTSILFVKYQNGSIDIFNKGTITQQKRVKDEQDMQSKKTQDEIQAREAEEKKKAEQNKIDSIIKAEQKKAESIIKAEQRKNDSIIIATERNTREDQKRKDAIERAEIIKKQQDEAEEKEAIRQLEDMIRSSKAELIDAKAGLQVEYDRLDQIKLFQLGRPPDVREQEIIDQTKIIEQFREFIISTEDRISKAEEILGYKVY